MTFKNTLITLALCISTIILLSVSGCSPAQQAAQTGIWEILDCEGMPTGRHENGFVEHNGLFYLFGGRGIKPVEVFDPETSIWTPKSATPFEMHHFQAVTIGDSIYVAGCMTGPYPEEPPVSHIQIYIPETDTWIQGPEIPESRRRGSGGTVVYNGKLYLIGGIQLGHTSGTVAWFDAYDLQTGEWDTLTDAPHIRDHFHAIVIDDKLYCVGGRNTSYHEPGNFGAFFQAPVIAVDCYDFKTGTWCVLDKPLPVGTAAGGVAHIGNSLLYFGGESGQQRAHSETQILDLAAGTWSLGAPLARGRHGSAAIQYDGKIYIAAGSGNRGGGPELTSIEQYTPGSEWISLFNGHDLNGWHVECLDEDRDKIYWTVENGAISCNSMGRKKHNYVWLMTDDEFRNFEFQTQFKAFRESSGNSGIQFHSRYDAAAGKDGTGWLDGPQVDIHPPNPFRTGLIYDETREEKRWIAPSLTNWEISREQAPHGFTFKYADEGWNTLRIVSRGTHVQTYLNGDLITDYNGAGVLDNAAHKAHHVDESGHFAFQLHANDELKIQFRDVKVRTL